MSDTQTRRLNVPQDRLLKQVRDGAMRHLTPDGQQRGTNNTVSWAVRRKLIAWGDGQWTLTPAGHEAIKTGRAKPPGKGDA